MSEKRDRTSVREIALDVATAIILVIGAITIEWLKRFLSQQELPFLTSLILQISELTLLCYFLIEFIKACRFLLQEVISFFRIVKPHIKHSQSLAIRLWRNRPLVRFAIEPRHVLKLLGRIALFLLLIAFVLLTITTAYSTHRIFGSILFILYWLIFWALTYYPLGAFYIRPTILDIAKGPLGWITIIAIILVIIRLLTFGIPENFGVAYTMLRESLLTLPSYYSFIFIGVIFVIYAVGFFIKLSRSTVDVNAS